MTNLDDPKRLGQDGKGSAGTSWRPELRASAVGWSRLSRVAAMAAAGHPTFQATWGGRSTALHVVQEVEGRS